jgi:hypothetical protein
MKYPVDGSAQEDTKEGWNIVRKWRTNYKNKTMTDEERSLILQQLPDFKFDHHAETQ